ncbi:MAG: oligosaccharide flippase family protein [Pseudomonadota bacterium]|nr:oligosaccharide flippase family protein [Pseudomonadota bacterium]
MIGLGRQAGILAFARFASYALMLISPVILVRLLPVEQFGEYREFILYTSFLSLVAAFSFNESLLYFVPAHANSPWRVVRQTNFLTACSSGIVIALLLVADFASHGHVVGKLLWPLVAYVLLFVNLDCWEYFLLATHRPGSVFLYSGGRMIARMFVVIMMALLTADVNKIIWSLVVLEIVRFTGSAVLLRRLDRSASEASIAGAMSAQLRYCIPAGLGMLLYMANRNLGNFAVAKILGAAALAQYSIGTYGEYAYLAVGNSIALVLLPEMVRRNTASPGGGLALWRRATIVYCILLFPIAILVARYAEPLVLVVFSPRYRPAIIVLKIHMLFMIRGCFDFSPALRAINKTRPFIFSNLTALVCSAAGLYWLLPGAGLAGAISTLVVSSVVEAAVLGWWTVFFYKVSVAELIPWKEIFKVGSAALGASLFIISSLWTQYLGFAGVVIASLVFAVVFVVLLRAMKVSEAGFILEKIKRPMMSMVSRVG